MVPICTLAFRESTGVRLQHCYAGVRVQSASISDPDNLDEAFSDGDQLVIKFDIDTAMAPVHDKWSIDKLRSPGDDG